MVSHALSGITTNLLMGLEALLSERTATRAAKRVGRGQPAMSSPDFANASQTRCSSKKAANSHPKGSEPEGACQAGDPSHYFHIRGAASPRIVNKGLTHAARLIRRPGRNAAAGVHRRWTRLTADF
jgi:hypothetical protein